jgi:hypothetical protein
VVFGLGGVATEVLGDCAARLTPLTDADADDLIHGARAAPLLRGHRGTSPVDTGALADVLLRVPALPTNCPRWPNSISSRCSPPRWRPGRGRPDPGQADTAT